MDGVDVRRTITVGPTELGCCPRFPSSGVLEIPIPFPVQTWEAFRSISPIHKGTRKSNGPDSRTSEKWVHHAWSGASGSYDFSRKASLSLSLSLMANNNSNREPDSAAPEAERWYNLTLGSSFNSQNHLPSSKFFTLRYEFKPASIDKNQAGSLHKNKENRVTVEFPNNQPGKPKVTFEGSTEDYKDNDGVLFFDGETFRLERLHRAMKRLRHVRLPGESASAAVAAAATSVGPTVESRSPPLGKVAKSQPLNKPMVHSVPVAVERIDIGESESTGPKPTARSTDYLSVPSNPAPISPDQKNYELEENLEIVDDEDGGTPDKTSTAVQEANTGFDINIPNLNDMDDEIADVDVSDDEADKGPNAAEALRAQVNAEGRDGQTSSSSGSSGSGSGSSSSSSDSSDSEASDNDSVSSGGDVDI